MNTRRNPKTRSVPDTHEGRDLELRLELVPVTVDSPRRELPEFGLDILDDVAFGERPPWVTLH